MKKINSIITVALITIVSVFVFIGCKDHNRNTLEGTVVAYEYCTSNVKGYLVEVKSPKGIGESVVIDQKSYSNVVKTYSQPTTPLQIGDQIMGRYQILTDSSICRVCEALHQYYDVPEVILSFNN